MITSALELFAGIGGFAAAAAEVPGLQSCRVTAVDIDRAALDVHQLNFPHHRVVNAELATFDPHAHPAQLWWLSPPCLPFTRKGKQRDADDPRTEALFALIGRIESAGTDPQSIVIENVPPFAQSRTGRWVAERLRTAGYETRWHLSCPSDSGWPVRRRRAYLLASRTEIAEAEPAPDRVHVRIADLIDRKMPAELAESLRVPQDWLDRFGPAMHLIDPSDSDAVACCFTSSYGRSPSRSGSYLAGERPIRFFSPDEVLRCLGFDARFRWSDSLSLRRRWHLAGNSLHLAEVRRVLRRLA